MWQFEASALKDIVCLYSSFLYFCHCWDTLMAHVATGPRRIRAISRSHTTCTTCRLESCSAEPNTKANNPIKHEYKIWIVFTHSHIHTQTQIQNANIHIETCLTTLVNCKMQNSNEIPLYMVMYRMVKILKIPQSVGKDVGKMNSHTLLLRKEK